MTESLGKIIGMALAYAISSLGLLLAYYNYRKRIIKADTIFTPAAWAIMVGVGVAVLAATLLVVKLQAVAAAAPKAAAAEAPLRQLMTEHPPIGIVGSPALGTIVPGAIFLFSVWMTWALYAHFARKMHAGPR